MKEIDSNLDLRGTGIPGKLLWSPLTILLYVGTDTFNVTKETERKEDIVMEITPCTVLIVDQNCD